MHFMLKGPDNVKCNECKLTHGGYKAPFKCSTIHCHRETDVELWCFGAIIMLREKKSSKSQVPCMICYREYENCLRFALHYLFCHSTIGQNFVVWFGWDNWDEFVKSCKENGQGVLTPKVFIDALAEEI